MINLCGNCVIYLRNTAWIMISIAMICFTVIIVTLIKLRCKKCNKDNRSNVTIVKYDSVDKTLTVQDNKQSNDKDQQQSSTAGFNDRDKKK